MTPEELAQKAAAVPVTEFVAKKVKIAVTDAEGKLFGYIVRWIQCFSAQQQREEASGSLDDDELEKYIKQLPNDKSQISSLLKAIMPADFEKDDDSSLSFSVWPQWSLLACCQNKGLVLFTAGLEYQKKTK